MHIWSNMYINAIQIQIDVKNEIIAPNLLKNMCHNSFYDKWFLSYESYMNSKMADGSHLGF